MHRKPVCGTMRPDSKKQRHYDGQHGNKANKAWHHLESRPSLHTSLLSRNSTASLAHYCKWPGKRPPVRLGPAAAATAVSLLRPPAPFTIVDPQSGPLCPASSALCLASDECARHAQCGPPRPVLHHSPATLSASSHHPGQLLNLTSATLASSYCSLTCSYSHTRKRPPGVSRDKLFCNDITTTQTTTTPTSSSSSASTSPSSISSVTLLLRKLCLSQRQQQHYLLAPLLCLFLLLASCGSVLAADDSSDVEKSSSK